MKINIALDAGLESGLADAHTPSHTAEGSSHSGAHTDILCTISIKAFTPLPQVSRFVSLLSSHLCCCCCCWIWQWSLKVETGEPTGAVALSQKPGKWLEEGKGEEAEELWELMEQLGKEQWEKLQQGTHSQKEGWAWWRRDRQISSESV